MQLYAGRILKSREVFPIGGCEIGREEKKEDKEKIHTREAFRNIFYARE